MKNKILLLGMVTLFGIYFTSIASNTTEKGGKLETAQITKLKSIEKLKNDFSNDTAKKSKDNWDKLLYDYESYVDSYIAFYKKAMNGDLKAKSEYPKLLKKAQSLSEMLSEANNNNEMNAKQVARYFKITAKLANAAY
jgi:hypothetical protein